MSSVKWGRAVVVGAVAAIAVVPSVSATAAPSDETGAYAGMTQAQARARLDADIAQALAHRAGGVRTGANEVEWQDGEGGKAVEVFPLPASLEAQMPGKQPREVSYRFGCPYGWTPGSAWYCFYENSNFNGVAESGQSGPGNGRMLKWSNWHGVTDLGDWNFRDKVSSWVNKTSYKIEVGDYAVAPNYYRLWIENGNQAMGYVGDQANDRADFFRMV
ncbi:hypothetical protein [Kitasatospora kifunensis]|uniref:Peptidase inhibitor family I36 n=1 Tax=Kitasatospora kifunensis TaxID=58351 RepID=A0A7W7R939_KITKI|nr:hypothetical protein [Kitasatospora kifunensis]MBB4927636.1 hypothetical protein [Kitasatospora kifunensis]